MLPRVVLALVLVSSLLAVGCGGRQARSTVPRPTDVGGGRSVHELMPRQTTVLAFADLEGLRASPLYEVMEEDFEAWEEAIGELLEETKDEPAAGAPADGLDDVGADDDGMDETSEYLAMLESAAWVAVAGSRPAAAAAGKEAQGDYPEGPAVTFVGAPLDESQVRTLVRLEARALLDEASDLPLVGGGSPLGVGKPGGKPGASEPEPAAAQVTEEQVGDRTLWVAAGSAAVQLYPRVWVLGERELVMEVIARADGEQALPVDSRTASLDAVVDPFAHDLAVTLVDLEIGGDSTSAEAPDDSDALEALLADVDAGGLAVDLEEGVRVELVLRSTHPDAAAALVSRLREERDEWLEQGPHLFGADRLLRRLEPVRDEAHVRVVLELDRAEAHLYWGRVSGAVSAGVLVAEVVMDFFGGLGDALGGGTPGGALDRADADRRPRAGTGVIVRASPKAPVSTGTSCRIRVEPHERQGDRHRCRARVTCEGKTLYGGPGAGWLPCWLGGDDGLSATDSDTTGADGDAAFSIDAAGRTFTVEDDADGPFGPYELVGDVESLEAE